MRVLITGVAGFLGATLARRLIKNEIEVVGMDIVPRDAARRLEGLKLDYRWQSIQDLTSIDAPFVVHTAAVADVPLAARSPIFTLQQNVLGSAMLLEACARHDGFERIIIQSSESVYGYARRIPIPEDEPLNPTNLYASSKAAQEMVAMSYYHSHKLPVTILRSCTLYGPNSRTNQVVPLFIQKALKGEPLRIEGDGNQSRSFNFSENMVDGILAALNEPTAVGEIFNIASGEETTILELAQRVLRLARADLAYQDTWEGLIEFIPARAGETGVRLYPDITKATRILGYHPRVSFEKGLALTIESFASH